MRFVGLQCLRHNRRLPIGAIAALAAVLLIVSAASAHDTWLIADSGLVAVGQPVILSLTSGDAFPQDDFAIDPRRVKRAVVRLGDSTRALSKPRPAAQALRYEWIPGTEGTAAAGVDLAPKILVLEPGKIEEYLREIDATPQVRAEWAALGGKRKWVESYSKHAKTFIRVGRPLEDLSSTRPLGLGLELVPERDPTALDAGQTLTVLVLHRGRPLAGFAVGAIHEGSENATFARTDSAGRARVVLASRGRWLLNGTLIRRSLSPKLVWESDFTTLTVRVH